MENGNIGASVREFFRGLFGSRLNSHLEEELLRLRSDYETRLMERQETIADLKEQISELRAKVDRYELIIMPLASPVGSLLSPRKERPPLQPEEPAELSWAEVQAQHSREQAVEP